MKLTKFEYDRSFSLGEGHESGLCLHFGATGTEVNSGKPIPPNFVLIGTSDKMTVYSEGGDLLTLDALFNNLKDCIESGPCTLIVTRAANDDFWEVTLKWQSKTNDGDLMSLALGFEELDWDGE